MLDEPSSEECYDFPEIRGKFAIIEKVGSGTFSEVFKARTLAHSRTGRDDQGNVVTIDVPAGRIVALKRICPSSAPHRIVNEAQFLSKLGGRNHIIGLLFIDRDPKTGRITLCLPYFEHDAFKSYYDIMNVQEIQSYMKALLEALRHIHSHNVIHRDVKPSNFLHKYFHVRCKGCLQKQTHEAGVETCECSNSKSEYRLVDLGLAHMEDLQESLDIAINRNSKLVDDDQKEYGNTDSRLKVTLPKHIPTDDVGQALSKSDKGHNVEEVKHASTHNSRSSFTESSKELPDSRNSRLNLSLSLPNQAAVVSTQLSSPLSTAVSPNIRDMARKQKIHLQSISQQRQGLVDQKRRPIPHVLRAGTRGYRAPEVMMRLSKQTCALDIWSAGAVLMSILTAKYPYFNAPDDLTGLLEIFMTLGKTSLEVDGRCVSLDMIPSRLPSVGAPIQAYPSKSNNSENGSVGHQDLELIEEHLTCLIKSLSGGIQWPIELIDLVRSLIEPDPLVRLTASEALSHPFFNVDARAEDVLLFGPSGRRKRLNRTWNSSSSMTENSKNNTETNQVKGPRVGGENDWHSRWRIEEPKVDEEVQFYLSLARNIVSYPNFWLKVVPQELINYSEEILDASTSDHVTDEELKSLSNSFIDKSQLSEVIKRAFVSLLRERNSSEEDRKLMELSPSTSPGTQMLNSTLGYGMLETGSEDEEGIVHEWSEPSTSGGPMEGHHNEDQEGNSYFVKCERSSDDTREM